MPYKLDTTEKIVRFIENLAHYIESVTITDIEGNRFFFVVTVPMWYKLSFGYFLKKKIRKELTARMFIGVEFDFELESNTWF